MQEIDFDKIEKNNKAFRFTSELHHCKDIDRQKLLTSIINYLNGVKTTEEDAQALLTEMCKDLTEQSMKKKWARLNSIQKLTKIKEYLKETLKHSGDRNKIQNMAVDMLNKGKLKTNKDIKYNDETFKIVEIYALKKEINKSVKDNKQSSSEESDSDSEDGSSSSE